MHEIIKKIKKARGREERETQKEEEEAGRGAKEATHRLHSSSGGELRTSWLEAQRTNY